MKKRLQPPLRLLGIAALLIVAGLIVLSLYRANPALPGTNVILNGIPFLLVFVGILLCYIALIVTASRYYSGYVSEKRYLPVLYACMGGIVAGILLMFQPFTRVLYTWGFLLLLLSLLSFMVVGHITPKKELVREE